jgi:ectoine hydroxylase-related dioxygenase (phytanoyl-CoA dioxygenase family)
MICNKSDIDNLHDNGFILLKNVLESSQIEKIKKIIISNPEGKGVPENIYSTSFKSFLMKSIKVEFKKIINSLYFLHLKNQLKLDSYTSTFFNQKSKISQIDGYHNQKQESEILPWHCDQSYSGAKIVKKIKSPDDFGLKFFFYLTNVGPGNGCTSYIPGSHKITYAVRSCMYEKKIKYQPYWSINDFVNLVNKKKYYPLIVDRLDSQEILNEFLQKAQKIILNKKTDFFDFSALPGDVLIFNEGGFHKGSKPTENRRVVLRYIYKKILK